MTIQRMSQANQFFFLSAVESHIDADVKISGHVTMITFKHHKDESNTCPLVVMVYRGAEGFKIGYDLEVNGKRIKEAESDYIPDHVVQGAIAAIVNDAIPADY